MAAAGEGDCDAFGVVFRRHVRPITGSRAANEMREAMQQLSAGEREVLELVAFDGMSPSEVAIALDLTLYAARLNPRPPELAMQLLPRRWRSRW